jgi:hypothetical protein
MFERSPNDGNLVRRARLGSPRLRNSVGGLSHRHSTYLFDMGNPARLYCVAFILQDPILNIFVPVSSHDHTPLDLGYDFLPDVCRAL